MVNFFSSFSILPSSFIIFFLPLRCTLVHPSYALAQGGGIDDFYLVAVAAQPPGDLAQAIHVKLLRQTDEQLLASAEAMQQGQECAT